MCAPDLSAVDHVVLWPRPVLLLVLDILRLVPAPRGRPLRRRPQQDDRTKCAGGRRVGELTELGLGFGAAGRAPCFHADGSGFSGNGGGSSRRSSGGLGGRGGRRRGGVLRWPGASLCASSVYEFSLELKNRARARGKKGNCYIS